MTALVAKDNTTYIKVDGMQCSYSCAGKVSSVVQKMDGVKECNVDFDKGMATVVFDDQKLETKDILEFFPNPAENYINIEYKMENNSKLAIVNILGEKIKEIDLSSSGFQRINVADLPNGIYFGRILAAGKLNKMKKIIVKR